ncbi:MAG: hypothetical protein ABFS34_05125 [Gemmatimonadota bacterium]
MRRSARHLAVLASALAPCAFSACGGDARRPEVRGESSLAGAVSPGDFDRPAGHAHVDLMGDWTIVAHRFAGPTSMPEEQARSWHGSTIRLAEREAVALENRCSEPAYSTHLVPTATYAARFRRWPPDFSLPVIAGRVEVMNVTCEGRAWDAPGASLTRVGDEGAFTVWEGVFFELERDHPDEG